MKALPVDFDPPAAADLVLELSRGETRRVAVRTGAARRHTRTRRRGCRIATVGPILMKPVSKARCSHSTADRDRSSRAKVAFHFDAVRSGDHRVELLKESLPEGAIVAGGNDRTVSITREHPQNDLTYLVVIEKRPEVRKVFPPRIGRQRTWPGQQRDAWREAGRAVRRSGTYGPERGVRTGLYRTPALFTIQVAALSDSSRAHKLVDGLKDSGFDAYLVEPGAAAIRTVPIAFGSGDTARARSRS